MKIEPPRAELRDPAALASELQALLRQPDAAARRPCPGCSLPCRCSASPACTCGCTPRCPNIARVCTPDPERHPLEPAVVPLVFELNTLRLIQTCWSCAGHAGTATGQNRPPRVWFYARAACYAQLLADHLALLRSRHRLSRPWLIRLISLGRGDTTYSLEPDPAHLEPESLPLLRRDLAVIGERLATRIRGYAETALTALERGAR